MAEEDHVKGKEVDAEEARRYVNRREEYARLRREERALLRRAMERKPAKDAEGVQPVPESEAAG